MAVKEGKPRRTGPVAQQATCLAFHMEAAGPKTPVSCCLGLSWLSWWNAKKFPAAPIASLETTGVV